MEWLLILEKAAWCGVAALGFAVLFNVPQRTLLFVSLLGFLGSLTKLLLIKAGAGLIFATLGGSCLVGLLAIWAAHLRHAPPLIFSIPPVIPMVPGVFAYRTMMGLVHLTTSPGSGDYLQVLAATFNYGSNTFFILFCLALGGALPFLITRKESAKKLKLGHKHRE